ncbi:pentapeptide repeat-containing protein [bacterium]|nr:pentapeptide repeat-containing protein [bacterium]
MTSKPESGRDHDGVTFRGTDLAGSRLQGSVFMECRFEACSFGETEFMDCRFVECTFVDTDLASASFAGSSFRAVTFERCRMTGVDWATAAWPGHPLPGDIGFEECTLDMSSVLGAPLAGTSFDRCSARETDFSGADLSGSSFAGTDLTGAVFRGTDLRGADLRTARGYSIDVTHNRVAGMRVALPEAMSLLDGLGIDVDEGPEQAEDRAASQPGDRPRIVFLCVHNAGRSQMAAGFARHLGGDLVEVFSGGSDPAAAVNQSAVDAMAEAGVDLGSAQPQKWTDEIVSAADVVITMGCGDTCPVFPGVRYEDWPLDDPEGLGVEAVRPIRDEIRTRVEDLLVRLGAAPAG